MKTPLVTSIASFLTLKQDTIFITGDSTLRQFMEKSDFHKYTVIPILDEEGRYRGSVSEGDVLRYIKNAGNFDASVAETVRIDEISHYRSYQAAKVGATMEEVFALLMAQNFVPITDDRGVFIGLILRRKVMDYYNRILSERDETND